MSDLISRQAAIEAFRKELCREREYIISFKGCERVLNGLPTAEPIKYGQWKPFDLTWGRSIYACTSCGEAFEVPTAVDKPIYDYCPNCGAKMDGGEDD